MGVLACRFKEEQGKSNHDKKIKEPPVTIDVVETGSHEKIEHGTTSSGISVDESVSKDVSPGGIITSSTSILEKEITNDFLDEKSPTGVNQAGLSLNIGYS